MENENKLRIFFLLNDYQNECEENKDFNELQDILAEVGIRLFMTPLKENQGYFSLTLDKDIYTAKRNRGAGRHLRKATYSDEIYKEVKFTYYDADIVYMMQSMTDKEIAEKIGMPIATYYRHKKRLKEKDSFKNLDLDRLQDKKYLEDQLCSIF